MSSKRTAAFWAACIVACVSLWDVACAQAADAPQTEGQPPVQPQQEEAPHNGLLLDAKAYVTAPLHWDRQDWLYFGGTLVAIGAAHHYDEQVRTHFTTGQYAGNLTSQKSYDLQDALPGAIAFAGTWAYATLIDDNNGRRETEQMLESAVFAGASSFVLKFAVGRERPNETANANQFFAGGGSGPSIHASAAFAIGTVLAESGSDDVRWIRRVLGYGIGAATAYERLKHNNHWLSDTVAGAALGISTAHFVMNRHQPPDYTSGISVAPIAGGGAMLVYSRTF